jgi:hypothetical protein
MAKKLRIFRRSGKSHKYPRYRHTAVDAYTGTGIGLSIIPFESYNRPASDDCLQLMCTHRNAATSKATKKVRKGNEEVDQG